MNSKREKLLRTIATALTHDPGIAYQQLAEKVGVSRRTLYRIAPSREALFELLRREAVAATFAALERAGLKDRPPLEALAALTRDFIDDAELYAFWVADTWGKAARPVSLSDGSLRDYRLVMAEFFMRGQSQAVFRPDLSVDWLIETYDALLAAAASSARKGTAPPAGLAAMIVDTFLRGAAA